MGRRGKKFLDEFIFIFFLSVPPHSFPSSKTKVPQHPQLLAGRGEKKRKEERETLRAIFSPLNKGFILKAIDSRKVSRFDVRRSNFLFLSKV